MSNNRANRIREMAAARQAGRLAFDEGKSIHSAPHNSVDLPHWRSGWQEREFEEQMAAKADVETFIWAVEDEKVRDALLAIWERMQS